MKPPYSFRIMAALPGHAPIELFRTNDKYSNYTWNHVTRGLDRAWYRWCEHTLGDRQCLSSRPKVKDHYANPTNYKFHLSYEEKLDAGVGANL